MFARHDELLLKRFQEEEDLHVYILLDCSRSMAFGEPPKFDYARQVAAALAYIALADLDRVAVVAFAGDIVADFPLTPRQGADPVAAQVSRRARAAGQRDRPGAAWPGTSSIAASAGGWRWCISDLFDPNGLRARARPAAAPPL